MKFWQKSFIIVLVVFIIFINICLYLISKYSFSLNMKRDTDRALSEYHIIIDGINQTMNSLFYREQAVPTPSSIVSMMRSYADYYNKQKVFLQLKQSDKLVFTNIPSDAISSMKNGNPEKDVYTINTVSNSGSNYLYIIGKLSGQFQDYSLTYVRDMSELYDTHSHLTRYLITISAIVEIILIIVLLLILRKLTHPIRVLQKATRKIAGGVYNGRVSIPGRDEFHDLAECFNLMSASIQEKINELDKNAQNKQRLIDNLAHEIRTPLTAIRGYAEYLQSANTSEENRIKATDYIINEIDRMKNLSFKLLDLAILRNSKLDFTEINPAELLNQVKNASEIKLKEKNIKLHVHSSLNKLIGDSVLLQSLLVNLIDNAVKASANNSIIELSAYYDTAPKIEVIDFGCGMDEEQVNLVCEPFYRVDKARSRSSGGVGLGLSLCCEIAKLHSAQLKINSHPGEGTTIQIIFTTSLQLSENSVTV